MRRGTAANSKKPCRRCGTLRSFDVDLEKSESGSKDRSVPQRLQGLGMKQEMGEGQISDTKNPGLSTRVFAIDSEPTKGCFRCSKAFSGP
ncbi:hypothetical protein KKQ10_24490 [Pseudomonas sp. MG-9]|uniref:Uncharacterized protein n=1 Tax=Pseudomonas serboccidentalis TaxID=2964670 RepID=A0ABY7Z3Y5_9PSED|nr:MULTISPECIES: hypothetical protein [Pseudomonas]MBT9268039.1 hypothetical protein [Pseudomonas sp. MG-9]WDR34346.1 hypothetical protein NN484_17725 [Pseudomonas serboccidentalis]